MKKELGKLLAVVFTGVLCAGMLTGCSGSVKVGQDVTKEEPEIEEEPGLDEDYEEPEFEDGYIDELEDFDEYEDVEDPGIEDETAGEPAEGLSDQVLMEGYYGFWDGDTEYMLGILSDRDFMINVVGASSPILYAEGEYTDNGDGTFTAKITSTDNDFAEGRTIDIKALGGPDISMSSADPELDKAVSGTYIHAGEKASDVDQLK